MPDPEEKETEELLRRAERGDSSAVQLLLDRHRSRLSKMVAVRMDSRIVARVDPSDVVQETLMQATRKLPDYLHNRPLPFYPWLRQLAWERLVHLHGQHVTAQKRSVNREGRLQIGLPDESAVQLADHFMASGTSPSDRVIRDEMRQRVRTALEKLALNDRELLVLRYLEQLSTKDIAAVLGISTGAVKTRHFRAVQRLQAVLSDYVTEK